MSKVIFVNRYFYPDHSATSQLLEDLAFDLAAVDVQVQVVTSRLRYDDPNAGLPTTETVNNVRIRRVWTTRFGRGSLPGRALDYLTFYLSVGWRLVRILRPQDVVVAKTDPPLISVVAALAARLRGAVLVNWLQDLFPEVATELHVPGMNFLGPLIRPLRNYSLRASVTNVAIGERMAQRLQAENVGRDRIAVIHNWSDGSNLYPLDREDNVLRKEWGLGDRFVVGYSGNLGRAHEFDTIIRAASLLGDTGDIVFLFIGGGAQYEHLQAQVAESGVGNIVFKPYQPRDRLLHSLGVPDVHLVTLQPGLEDLIVPSKFYGIAAVGRPVIYIGSADGEVPGIMRESRCGITIDTSDAQGLRDCILSLLVDSDLVEDMGRNARAVFEARFDKTVALEAWRNVIRAALVSGENNKI